MQDIKYVNHLGEEVSLGRGTYKMLKDTSGIKDIEKNKCYKNWTSKHRYNLFTN